MCDSFDLARCQVELREIKHGLRRVTCLVRGRKGGRGTTQKVGVAQGDTTGSLEAEVGYQGLGNGASGKSEEVSKYIDDEALRLIVAEIIRQELRSSLGERITSNIRAMVHREIEVAFSENLKK